MPDYAPMIERAFNIDVKEDSYAINKIEGKVPDFIRGTYYMNGPGRFSRGGFRYRHWLDGDGLVCRLNFGDGAINFTNRFIRSTKFVQEENTNRPIFRTFGTAFESDQLKQGMALESPVNISIYTFNRTLL